MLIKNKEQVFWHFLNFNSLVPDTEVENVIFNQFI